MRVTYSDDHNFVIRYIPSPVHEEAHLEFTTRLSIALVLLTVPPHSSSPPGCKSVGATTFRLGPKMKEADAGVRSTLSQSRLPSVVLEVGDSESLSQLRIDGRLWIEHTQEVWLVILISIDPPIAPSLTLPRITIELWKGLGVQRPSCTRSSGRVRIPSMVWSADWTLGATPFYIVLDDIFRGQVPAEYGNNDRVYLDAGAWRQSIIDTSLHYAT